MCIGSMQCWPYRGQMKCDQRSQEHPLLMDQHCLLLQYSGSNGGLNDLVEEHWMDWIKICDVKTWRQRNCRIGLRYWVLLFQNVFNGLIISTICVFNHICQMERATNLLPGNEVDSSMNIARSY